LEHKTSLSGGGAMNHKVYIDPGLQRIHALRPVSRRHGDGLEDFSAIDVRERQRSIQAAGDSAFADGAGKLKPQSDPLPQTAGCIGCHRREPQPITCLRSSIPISDSTPEATESENSYPYEGAAQKRRVVFT
jgi:hypothetical protein